MGLRRRLDPLPRGPDKVDFDMRRPGLRAVVTWSGARRAIAPEKREFFAGVSRATGSDHFRD